MKHQLLTWDDLEAAGLLEERPVEAQCTLLRLYSEGIVLTITTLDELNGEYNKLSGGIAEPLNPDGTLNMVVFK